MGHISGAHQSHAASGCNTGQYENILNITGIITKAPVCTQWWPSGGYSFIWTFLSFPLAFHSAPILSPGISKPLSHSAFSRKKGRWGWLVRIGSFEDKARSAFTLCWSQVLSIPLSWMSGWGSWAWTGSATSPANTGFWQRCLSLHWEMWPEAYWRAKPPAWTVSGRGLHWLWENLCCWSLSLHRKWTPEAGAAKAKWLPR